MKKVAIYSELKNGVLDNCAYELISKACELKKMAQNISDDTEFEITCIAISDSIDKNSIQKAFSAGANNFVLIKNQDFEFFNQIKYSKAFLTYINQNFHDYILFPATQTGRMVAPRVTTALDTGLVADCTGINFILKNNELKLASTRPTFGSELMATILSKKAPECATVRPKTFSANFQSSVMGRYIEFPCSISDDFDLRLIEQRSLLTLKKDYSSSKIIFCAGFGLYDGDNNEYINKLKEITEKLNIDFAITRKLVDYGILSAEYQIGQTGSTAQPELYVAFGVSGAIQHIQGMKNSKTIVAINTDPNAEIFKYSDYKIIADVRDVIDKLYKLII